MARMRDFVFERSDDMKYRMQTVDRDVRDGLRELMGKTGIVSGAKRYAYYGIAALDMASAMPTWLGAYEEAMAGKADGGLGMGEKDAIYFADKSVRNAHGGGDPEDVAQYYQNGNEFQKLADNVLYFSGIISTETGRVDIRALRDQGCQGGRNERDFAAVALARSVVVFRQCR